MFKTEKKSQIKKIHIIGGPGSGKTYLSRKLSKKLGIKYYNLDDIVWDPQSKYYDTKVSEQKRSEGIKEIIKNSSWIIEGAYYDPWVAPSFKKADLIIVLQPNIYLCDYRILKRFIKNKLGFKKGKKQKFEHLIRLLKLNKFFNASGIEDILKVTSAFSKKRYFFKTADEVLRNVFGE